MTGIPLQDHHTSLLMALKPFIGGKSPKLIDYIVDITQKQMQIAKDGIDTLDSLKGQIADSLDNAFMLFLILVLLLATQGVGSGSVSEPGNTITISH